MMLVKMCAGNLLEICQAEFVGTLADICVE